MSPQTYLVIGIAYASLIGLCYLAAWDAFEESTAPMPTQLAFGLVFFVNVIAWPIAILWMCLPTPTEEDK